MTVKDALEWIDFEIDRTQTQLKKLHDLRHLIKNKIPPEGNPIQPLDGRQGVTQAQRSKGQIAYEAFVHQPPDAKTLWDVTDPILKQSWERAAKAVLDTTMADMADTKPF